MSNWLSAKQVERAPLDAAEVQPTAGAAARVRPMLEFDLPRVLEIERGAYPFPWSEGIFKDCLRVGYCCWVIERTPKLEGYGIMSVGAGESHILNLCVRKQSHGCGYGRQLLRYLLKIAREHHARTTLLEVRPSNAQALRLYHGIGFNEVGIRRAYYPGRKGREDALILAIELAAGVQ